MAAVPVRFLSKFPPYNANEVAGFEEEESERLIRLGIATPFYPDRPVTAPATENEVILDPVRVEVDDDDDEEGERERPRTRSGAEGRGPEARVGGEPPKKVRPASE